MPNRWIKVLAPLAVLGALTLPACGGGGVNVHDADALKDAATKQAQALGSNQVTVLTISDDSDGPSGSVSVRDAKGQVTSKSLKGERSLDPSTTFLPGVALDAVPWSALIAALDDAQAKCPDKAGIGALDSTPTGKSLVAAKCPGQELPVSQQLDGKPVAVLSELTSAESLETTIADARTILGPTAVSIRLTIGDKKDPMIVAEAPAATSPDGKCAVTVSRTTQALIMPTACNRPGSGTSSIPLDKLTGAKVHAALTKAAQQMKLSDIGQIGTAQIYTKGDRIMMDVKSAVSVALTAVEIS